MMGDLFSEDKMDEEMASSLLWKFHSALVRFQGIMGVGWETKVSGLHSSQTHVAAVSNRGDWGSPPTLLLFPPCTPV